MPRRTAKPNEIEARRRRIADLRISGYDSPYLVAKQISVSVSTVKRDFAAIDDEWRAERVALIDAERDKDRKRLERMLRAIWPKVIAGDLVAIKRALEILTQRARLLGLNTPMPRIASEYDDPLLGITAGADASLESLARVYADQNGLDFEEVLAGSMQLYNAALKLDEGKS